MEQDLFLNLPPEIITDILSRLPIKSIGRCKCVCKSWLDLVKSDEFVKSHLSKSVPSLALPQWSTNSSKPYHIFEFTQNSGHLLFNFSFTFPYDLFLNLPQEIMMGILCRLPVKSILRCKSVCKAWLDLIKSDKFVKYHCSKSFPSLARSKTNRILEFVDIQNLNLSISFNFPHEVSVHGSANRLLLLVEFERIGNNVFICNPFICNPITREYIRLPSPLETPSSQHTMLCRISFGFGVSNVSGEYKVVGGYKFKVYTLRTGSWRSTSASVPLRKGCVFLNGKLHWSVREGQSIECFDLETECFSSFSLPEFVDGGCRRLCELGDQGLWVCHNSDEHDIIWMMKEYGDDKSWTKGFLIKKPLDYWGVIKPIKIFKDRDIIIMITINEFIPELYHYSTKTNTFQKIDLSISSSKFGSKPGIYTPSFFPLKTFSEENVSLF